MPSEAATGMNVSVSEINSYLRCRRAWNWTSANWQGLRHKKTPKPYFVTGSAVHAALEAQAEGRDPFTALEQYIAEETERQAAYYRETVGSDPWPEEWDKFNEAVELARVLTRQYFDRYGTDNPLDENGLRYVATEVSFKVPLDDADQDHLIGTWDGLAISEAGQFYIVENKTLDNVPSPEALQQDNQLLGYVMAFRAITGLWPAGVLYNVIVKKVIKPPRVLNNGRLSVAKDQQTTLQAFLDALQAGGHDPFDEKYTEYLQYLAARETEGDERFFHRQFVSFTPTQVEQWSDMLRAVLAEMTAGPRIYPNFSNQQTCKNCVVRDLCQAQQHGEDVQPLIDQRYERGSYGTVENIRRVEPVMVSTPEELIEALCRTSSS